MDKSMTEYCDDKYIIVYQGYPTRWDDVDWLSISFKGEISLEGFRAIFRISDYSFEINDLSKEWILNLTKEQTETLPLGLNSASLIVYDVMNNGKPFTTAIPILVKNWVDGDVKIDTYKASITATLDNKAEFVINVETSKVSIDYVDEKISEHNIDVNAHQYIRNLIDEERFERELENSQIIEELNEKQDKLIAGENITIINNVISSSGGGVSNLDGGNANSIYLNTQIIDGGDAV